MKSSLYFWKEVLCWIFLCSIQFHVDGRRYDKCETTDGRQGVCVVKRYCREASIQPLVRCDNEDNFCCPIPTTQRSAQPPVQIPQTPRRDIDTYATPKSVSTTTDERQNGRSPNSRQTPVVNPERTLENFPVKVPEYLNPPDRKQMDDHQSRQPVSTYDKSVQTIHSQNRSNYGTPRRDESKERPLRKQVPQGRIKFEDQDYSVPGKDDNKNPSDEKARRLLPPVSFDDTRLPNYPPESRKNVSSPERSRGNDRRKTTKLPTPDFHNSQRPQQGFQRPTVGYHPSKDDLEVERLPSNPRRLKPLRHNTRNSTDPDDVRSHVIPLYPHESSMSQPKVPACGVKPYDLFIAGGENSEPFEWPWMTAIFRRHQGSRPKTFLCGGSLINTKYILTAAHCFVNNYVVLPASSFVVRLGSHLLDSGEEYTVGDLIIHHNHSGSDFFNDIALIRLASEVFITDKIAPICLPSTDMISQNFVNRMATVAGWGDTSFRTGSSRQLQHVTIPIVSSEDCFAAYSRVRGAAFLARGSDHVICAGLREGGKDACLGDSGGPLMLKTVDDRWTVVGIVSLGYKCAEPGYPGVYTRVTHYMSWMQSHMKSYES